MGLNLPIGSAPVPDVLLIGDTLRLPELRTRFRSRSVTRSSTRRSTAIGDRLRAEGIELVVDQRLVQNRPKRTSNPHQASGSLIQMSRGR